MQYIQGCEVKYTYLPALILQKMYKILHILNSYKGKRLRWAENESSVEIK